MHANTVPIPYMDLYKLSLLPQVYPPMSISLGTVTLPGPTQGLLFKKCCTPLKATMRSLIFTQYAMGVSLLWFLPLPAIIF